MAQSSPHSIIISEKEDTAMTRTAARIAEMQRDLAALQTENEKLRDRLWTTRRQLNLMVAEMEKLNDLANDQITSEVTLWDDALDITSEALGEIERIGAATRESAKGADDA